MPALPSAQTNATRLGAHGQGQNFRLVQHHANQDEAVRLLDREHPGLLQQIRDLRLVPRRSEGFGVEGGQTSGQTGGRTDALVLGLDLTAG